MKTFIFNSSWILNNGTKCLWNKSFICSGTCHRRSTRNCADYSLQLSNTAKHSSCTLYSLTQDIIRLSQYVLRYMLLNITHYFTLYSYMNIHTHWLNRDSFTGRDPSVCPAERSEEQDWVVARWFSSNAVILTVSSFRPSCKLAKTVLL
jgi:hypothetical protein